MTSIPSIKRVAVIGAGISGVVAAAHLLAAGLEEVVVFERNKAAGGVWYVSYRHRTYASSHLFSKFGNEY
jgi:cation diffusion facilitator CzcD-associated flavoprotein CzcO